VLGAAVVVILVILAVGYLGSRGGSGAGSGYDGESGYPDTVLAELSRGVTVNRLQDPWVPGSATTSAGTGRRFVALEVTVEGLRDFDAPTWVSPELFKLTDSEGYAYAASDGEGARPRLASIDLGAGEKTRGWLTFEVDESAVIRSVSYWGVDLKLP